MVIIYGGSFNPPTTAHFLFAQKLMEKYHPKAFIFVPVGNSYRKPEIINIKFRYEMLQILCQKLPGASVSLYEDTDAFKGTADTLDYFQNKYREDTIYYCLGADNLVNLKNWIRADYLVSHYSIIILKRGHADITAIIRHDELLSKFEDHFIIADFPEIPVSATRFRANQEDSVVLPEIQEYIYEHHLYNRGVMYEK